MKPVNQGVTPLDLQNVRKQNEDSLQTRATQHLGADLKAGSQSKLSKEERLTAGQGDQVELGQPEQEQAKTRSAGAKKTASPAQTTEAPAQPQAEAGSSAETNQPEPVETGTEEQPKTPEEGSSSANARPEYTDSEKAFLERVKEVENQAKEMRAMWRKLYNEWMEAQLKWMEDLENFRQGIATMWQEITVSRSIQSVKHAEAVRSLL